MKTYMAVDQYGHTEHDLGPHPRKELLARYDQKKAAKQYTDKKNGPPVHTGWIVAGHWFTVFERYSASFALRVGVPDVQNLQGRGGAYPMKRAILILALLLTGCGGESLPDDPPGTQGVQVTATVPYAHEAVSDIEDHLREGDTEIPKPKGVKP